MNVNMEGVDFVGVWKVVGCVVLGTNTSVANCNGASLILRPDGSFSWFGPQTGGIFKLNEFCAYKIVERTTSHSSGCGENVTHPAMSILFESGCDSIHSQQLCCEITMNFGNTMVLQFPGHCLMHFCRLSKDFRSDSTISAESMPLNDKSYHYEMPTGACNSCECFDESLNVSITPGERISGVHNPAPHFSEENSRVEGMSSPQSAHVLEDSGRNKGSSENECFSETGKPTLQDDPGCIVSAGYSTSHPSVALPGTSACPPLEVPSILCPTILHPHHQTESTPSKDVCHDAALPDPRNNSAPNIGSSINKSCEVIQESHKIRNSSQDPETPSTSSSSSSPSSAMSSIKSEDSTFSLLRALQEGYFSDLVLIAENGVKFEVHSSILALSFPNIDWCATPEEDKRRNVTQNCENHFPVSAKEPCDGAISNACKCEENRGVNSQTKKTKSKLFNMHTCCHSEEKNPKGNMQSFSPGEGLGEGIQYQKRPQYECDQYAMKGNTKHKEEKVKLPILPEDVLGALLHYAYSESLPPSLAPVTAEQCLKVLAPPHPLATHTVAFRNLCCSYLRNSALRKDIVSLTSGIHGCLSKMEEHLTMGDYHGMLSSEEDEEEDDLGRRPEGLNIRQRDRTLPQPTPSRLCSALKQAAREASLALVLALELCQVYAKNQGHLGKTEVHEVAMFAASRLAPLASQLDAILSAILRSIPPAISPVIVAARHSPPLNDNQRHNGGHEHHQQPLHGDGSTLRDRLASHLVPEMESALEVLSTLAMCLKEDMEEILQSIRARQTGKGESSPSRDEKTNFLVDDEGMLSCIHQRIAFYLYHLMQKKESFSDLGNGGRFRVICQTLDQLSEELPIFLLRLRDALATIDEQLAPEHLSQPLAEWTSKVCRLLDILSANRSILQPLLLMISELVQREAFILSLQRLKLLNYASEGDEYTVKAPSFSAECDSSNYKLSLVCSLVTPPPARRSQLSRRALRLLRSGLKSDMVFQVALTSSSECNNPPFIDTKSGILEWDEDSLHGGRWVWRIGAHRAIVAARCDWFRRALLSGMKEAIKRQIVVHDTTPQQLLLFLQWIYGGQLQIEWNQEGILVQEGRKDSPHGLLGAEQLWALLVLADQLEVDDLKNACERILLRGGCHLADPEATLACLSLADQVNAKAMRSACLQHISSNPKDVVESELFEELPSSLQSEVYDRLIWSRPSKLTAEYPFFMDFILNADIEHKVLASDEGGKRPQKIQPILKSQTTEWLLSSPEEDDDDEGAGCEKKSEMGFSYPLHGRIPSHGRNSAIGADLHGAGENSRRRANSGLEELDDSALKDYFGL